MALGYTLVYGIIELINFAHGEIFMIGAFTSFALWGTLGLTADTGTAGLVGGLLVTLVVAMFVSGSLNVMIERVGYRPLRGRAEAGAADHRGRLLVHPAERGHPLARRLAARRAGPDPLAEGARSTSLGISISRGDLLAVVVTIPLVLLLTSFVAQSRLGKAMRATAQDPEAAKLMGINVDTTISLTFLLGGLLAGAAGLINTLYQTSVWYFQGFTAGLIAFTAAVMGGIGNLRGAVLGGLIIGCIQQVSDNRIGNEWTPAVIFAYLVLIMVFRPQG